MYVDQSNRTVKIWYLRYRGSGRPRTWSGNIISTDSSLQELQELVLPIMAVVYCFAYTSRAQDNVAYDACGYARFAEEGGLQQ